MSEKIFAWFLRLYPTHFRKAYGEEALLLLRDRDRDEQRFLLRCRLWLDLLADLAVSIPREYRNNPQVILGASARPSWNGIPSFQMLEGEAPTLSSLLFGGALSLVIYASILFLIGHGTNHFSLPDASTRQRPSYALSPTPAPPTGESNQSSGDDQAASRESNSPPSSQGRAMVPKKQFKEFDAASIRESKTSDPTSRDSKTSDPTPTNRSLGPSDMCVRSGGYFHRTNLSLFGYITFAYKLNGYQSAELQVPDWVKLTKYDIEARVQGDPDEEDMRIMMRALLADRFKLKMHSEAQQVPALNMALTKPRKPGPALKLPPDAGPVEIYVLDHVERPSEN